VPKQSLHTFGRFFDKLGTKGRWVSQDTGGTFLKTNIIERSCVMKRMGRYKVILFLTGVFLLMSVSLAYGWGPDVPIWTSGTVDCFDVDYATDGTMYVGFQAGGENIIRVYSSTNHGLTWTQLTTLPTDDSFYGTSPRNDLSRIRLLYDEQNSQLFVFFVDSGGYLYRTRIPIPSLAPGLSRVSTAPILEGSFDVTWDLKSSGRKILVMWTEGNDAGNNIYIKYTTTFAPVEASWTASYTSTWGIGGDTRASLAFGPSNNFFYSYSTKNFGGGSTDDSVLEIATKYSSDSGSSWSGATRLTDNAYKDYDPRISAANVTSSGVWVLYNRDRGGNEIDLYFKYSPNGGVAWNASEYTVSALTGADEYISDVKFYKIFPNQYLDMVYIYDDPSSQPVRKAIWAYTSTGNPTNWVGQKIFTDHDITSEPEDVAPRIVYSPGASASGGGAVFSYAGKSGLYFDAPWITPMPLPTGPTTITYSYVADPVNSAVPTSAKPMGVGNIASGTATVRVAFSEFAANVDIYIAVQIPGYSDLQLITSNNDIVPLDWASPAKWRSATPGPVDVVLFNYPRSGIPSGPYTLYILVVPAGTSPATFDLATSAYYLWNFTVTN
jgi:hypothetical protein